MNPFAFLSPKANQREMHQRRLNRMTDISRIWRRMPVAPQTFIYGDLYPGLLESVYPTCTASSTKFPTVVTQQNFGNPSLYASWSGLSNVLAADGSVATANITTTVTNLARITVSGFGFAVPVSATVDWFIVEFSRSGAWDSGTHGTTSTGQAVVSLTKTASDNSGFNSWGGGASFFRFPLIPTAVEVNGAGTPTVPPAFPLWGTTWTPSEVNSSDFGVIIHGSGGSWDETESIDYIKATVCWH